MATDVSQLPYSTFIDIVNNYSSTDANAMLVSAARVLDRQCPLLSILPMMPSNNVLSNVAVRTDSLPVPGTRRFNIGVGTTAAHNTQISDPMALWEDYSDTDKELCNIQNDPTAWRLDQDASHMEGFRQLMESTLFYGSLGFDPGSFNGLSTRFNNLESYPNGDQSWVPNVWNNGATTGNSTSIWALEFGPKKITGLYPRNTAGGLMVDDLGERTKEYASSTNGSAPYSTLKLQVYSTHLRWWMGLQVQDERCVQRIANINPTALSANNFDENVLIEALTYLPGGGDDPSTVILCNRGMKAQIDIRAVSQKLNAYYTQNVETGDIWGKRVTRFQGIPILMSEKILNTETIVS